MSNLEERITGGFLNKKWNVRAKHALYREDGKWYHLLTSFPGALFDAHGYVLFETEAEYRNCSYLQIGKTAHVPEGISSIPNYVCMSENSIEVIPVEDVDIEDGDENELVEDDVIYEGGSIYPYDMPEEVDIREEPQTVFEWMRRLNTRRLIIDPEFQRNLVWKPEQKSQFIESVLLNIPLPPLYVNQRRDGHYIIVDGLQRTSTLNEFINEDKFALSGLKVLTHINGLKFSQLEQRFQAKIEDKKFFVYVIKPTVPIQMVYDIFHRINTGGTQLTRQEIRNCFYIGPATRLLKELSELPSFRRAISEGISSKRMKDREAVLRYLAFRILSLDQYKNDMDAFLSEALNRMNLMHDAERDGLRRDFERVMAMTYDFWGERNFRLPTPTTRGRINIALLESVCLFFSNYSNDILLRHKTAILNNYDQLLKDEGYIDAIQFATGDRKRVIRRFELAQEILGRF